MTYRYVWANNEKRAAMRGRLCRVIAAGKMRSVLVEFVDNGQKEITDVWALRRCDKKG